VLDEEARERFGKIRKAICLYIDGSGFSKIQLETQICKSEVIRYLKRCLRAGDRDLIVGFYALLPYFRMGRYCRSKPVEHSLLAGSSGCSGALEQLLTTHPIMRKFLETKFLVNPDNSSGKEVMISFTDLHKQFVEKLRNDLNFSDGQWPFCTKNRGYKSIVRYCNDLIRESPRRWILCRSGKAAARRLKVGAGVESVFQTTRPMTTMQLDYLKQDAAGIINITDINGVVHKIPSGRWYVGILIEKYTSAIFGFYLGLEVNPSADCVLETVQSAFDSDNPDVEISGISGVSAKVLMAAILPELRNAAFALLELDNAFGNAANDVVNNFIDSIGCAVRFCVKRAWYQHAVIERVNKQLQERGMHRLVSTFGSDPTDPKKNDPDEKAIKYDISIEDLAKIFLVCIREHNTKLHSDRHFGVTRENVLRSLMENPKSGFLLQRFPYADKGRRQHLLWHEEICTIRGNIKKGQHPYVQVDRWRYTNETLATQFSLIGKSVVVRVSRRDPRIAVGVVIPENIDLGRLMVEPRWRNTKLTWQVRKVLMRELLAGPDRSAGPDDVHDYPLNKKKKLTEQRRQKKSVASADARLIRKTQDLYDPPAETQRPIYVHDQSGDGDAFGALHGKTGRFK
jgi:hypothetical protein